MDFPSPCSLVRIWSRETGSAIPSRPASARSFFTLRMNHQSSIINHQSPIINHQSSIINHQSSIINHQSSIINHKSVNSAYSQDSSLLLRRPPHKPPTAIESVPSLLGHAIAWRWRSLPRAHRPRASSPQRSSSNWCCLFRFHHGPIFVRLSFPTFPTPTIGMMWA